MYLELETQVWAKVKQKWIMKWRTWDDQFLKNKDKDWQVHSFITRTLRFPNLGNIVLKRRLYYNKKTGKWDLPLDRKLSLEPYTSLTNEVKSLVWSLVRMKMGYKSIRQWLKKDKKVLVSEASISRTIKKGPKEQEKGTKEGFSEGMYFWTDEGFLTLKVKGQNVKVRGRITSSALRKVVLGKRGVLEGKNCYLSLHQEGEKIDNKAYWRMLKGKAGLKEGKTLFWAKDGASNLKTLVKESGAVHIFSKFHWKRRLLGLPKSVKVELEREHEEVLKNWKNPQALGYWSESDIAHILKGYLGQGNKVWSLESYKICFKLKE